MLIIMEVNNLPTILLASITINAINKNEKKRYYFDLFIYRYVVTLILFKLV